MSFKEKLKGWLGYATMNFKDGLYDYDPSQYSIEEWEEYLLKKNNSLTYETFLKRNRWTIKHSIYDIYLDGYLERLTEAKNNSSEFMTDEEFEYVKNLLPYLRELRINCVSLSKARWSISGSRDFKSKKKEANKEYLDAFKLYNFCRKWKWRVDGKDIPESVKTTLAKVIEHDLYRQRRRWNYLHEGSRVHIWDETENNTYKRALEYGIIGKKRTDGDDFAASSFF